MDNKINVIIETIPKEYNLIAYFKIISLNERFIIYNKSNITFIAKLKRNKDVIKIVKPNKKEMKLIDKILNNDNYVKIRRIPFKNLKYVIYSSSLEITYDDKRIDKRFNNKLKNIRNEKEDLKIKLQNLKNKKNVWNFIKKKSTSIINDALLNDIDEYIKDLELEEFYEKCKINIIKVIVINIISLIIIALLLFGINIIGFIMSLFNSNYIKDIYLNNILKLYGITSLIVLFMQIMSLSFYKNFLGKFLIIMAFVYLMYVSLRMTIGYVYSFSTIIVFIIAIINICINFVLYLKLQFKKIG